MIALEILLLSLVLALLVILVVRAFPKSVAKAIITDDDGDDGEKVKKLKPEDK